MPTSRKPKRLTKGDIAKAKPGSKTLDLGTPGLYLFFDPPGARHPDGLKRWMFRYRRPGSRKPTEIKIGHLPNVSLEQARAAVRMHHYYLEKGTDPQDVKKISRGQRVTFAEVADEWLKRFEGIWSEVQIHKAKLLLHTHGKPLSREAVATIPQSLVTAAITPLRKTAPVQARRVLAMWERVFDFARTKGYRTWDNPARWKGLQEYLFPPQQKRSARPHHSAMDYSEIPEFIRRLRKRTGTGPDALEFLLLTGARTSEVTKARWDEFKGDLWTLPPHRTKQRREHRVPLSNRAMALLDQQREHANGSPWVFNGYLEEGLAEKTLYSLLRTIDPRATVHGFRSAFRDWCGNETNFPRDPVEQSLAHQAGDATETAYRRSDVLAKRRVIMEAWSSFCEGQDASLQAPAPFDSNSWMLVPRPR